MKTLLNVIKSCSPLACFLCLFLLVSGVLSSGCNVNANNGQNEHPTQDSVQHDIYPMTIIVDGNTEDWGDVPPQVVDPVGDAGSFPGLDITGIYVSKDENMLYVRISRAGIELPLDNNTWLHFSKAFNGEYSFAVEILRGLNQDPEYLEFRLWDTSKGTDYKDYVLIQDPRVQVNANNQDIELAIEISSIDLQPFHEISFYTHDKDKKNTDSLDVPVIINCMPGSDPSGE